MHMVSYYNFPKYIGKIFGAQPHEQQHRDSVVGDAVKRGKDRKQSRKRRSYLNTHTRAHAHVYTCNK